MVIGKNPSSHSAFCLWMIFHPASSNALATAFACSGHRSGKMRRTGIRPSLPCHGPSKSMSRSTFLKKGRTLSQFQPIARGTAPRVLLVIVGGFTAIGDLALDLRTTAHGTCLFIGAQEGPRRVG